MASSLEPVILGHRLKVFKHVGDSLPASRGEANTWFSFLCTLLVLSPVCLFPPQSSARVFPSQNVTRNIHLPASPHLPSPSGCTLLQCCWVWMGCAFLPFTPQPLGLQSLWMASLNPTFNNHTPEPYNPFLPGLKDNSDSWSCTLTCHFKDGYHGLLSMAHPRQLAFKAHHNLTPAFFPSFCMIIADNVEESTSLSDLLSFKTVLKPLASHCRALASPEHPQLLFSTCSPCPGERFLVLRQLQDRLCCPPPVSVFLALTTEAFL